MQLTAEVAILPAMEEASPAMHFSRKKCEVHQAAVGLNSRVEYLPTNL